MNRIILPLAILLFALSHSAGAGEREILFNGKDLGHWEFPAKAWHIDDTGALACRMKTVTAKSGKKRLTGMGYIWSRKQYSDFELRLAYKLSPAANSGVFYRTDKENPVQGGFEIQLMDNAGYQKAKGKKDPKKLNGSFYDAKAPSSDPSNPPGEWNDLKLICQGPRIRLSINGTEVFDVNVDKWDTAGKNPDGTRNKFKTALKDLPRRGHIGLQNHGQHVWFRDIVIRPL